MRNRKLKAATLIETIVAMVIITIVFSFSVIIYLNVSSSSELGYRDIQTRFCRNLATELSLQSEYKSKEIEYGEERFQVDFRPYSNFEGVLALTVSLSSDPSISHQILVYAD